MNELVILAAVNIVLWIAAFALIFTMVGRQKNMDAKFNALAQHLQKDTDQQTE